MPREAEIWCLRNWKVPEKLFKFAQMMFKGTRTAIISARGKTNMSEARVG